MAYLYSRNDIYELSRVLSAKTRQKGDELFFKYCPYCHGGGERDRDTFSINLETGVFHCFRSGCGKSGHFVEMARDFGYHLENDHAPRRYKRLPQKEVTVRDRAVAYLASRGISRATAEKYRVTTWQSDERILAFPFYDENNVLTFVKYRNMDFVKGQGNKEWCEKDAKPILFGMAQCVDFTRLVVTEGQIDSLSVADCGVKNAVSVPNGCNGFTFLDHVWDWITKFEEIVVFGDCEGGKITLLDTLVKRIPAPTRVKGVRVEDYLGEKDANDIYRKFGRQAILTAVENAQVPPVKHVVELADVESVDPESLPRLQTGIRELDRVIGGLYYGQLVLLTGKRGEGKSTFLSQLIVEALDQGVSVFAYSGELAGYHFKRWVDLQAAGPEHIIAGQSPSGEELCRIPPEIIERLNSWYRGRAYLYDNNAVDGEETESLIATIEHTIQRYDVKLICVDNLMTAMDVTSDSLYQMQSAFVKSLKDLAIRHNVVVILVAHPRKTPGNIRDNDDVSGSSDITNRIDLNLCYSRNPDKKSPDDLDTADSRLSVLKNRLTGRITREGQEIELFYSRKSKRISSLSSNQKVYGWEKAEEAPDYDWLIE